jgi:hypothetical protein
MDPTPTNIARGTLAALVALLLSVLGNYLLGPAASLRHLAGGQLQPDLAFLATPSMMDGYLRAIGEAGRQLYTRAEWFDFADAVLIGATGSLVIRWLATQLPSDVHWPRMLHWIPILAGLLDVVENTMILRTLKAFPVLTPSLLPWITSTKLLLIFFSLIAIAGLAAIALRLRRLAPIQV